MDLESFELRRSSKIDLHRHLDCSLRWSTFVELLKEHQVTLPKDNEELIKKFIVTEPMRDLQSVLQKFLSLQQVFSSAEILTRIGYEAVEDAYNDGVVKLELRYAPTFIQEKYPKLSFDEIQTALLTGIKQAERKFPIKVGLIVILQRIKDLKTNEMVADFVLNRHSDLIGVDLADNEAAALPSVFKNLFSNIHSKSNLGVTIHAGESVFPQLEKSIEEAIGDLGAKRLGHGVQVFRYPHLVEKVRRQKIHLEICPISNYLTKSFPDWESHSLPWLYREGVSLSINSDDPGMFGTALTDDFIVCQKYYKFKPADFKKIYQMANEASFIK